MWPFSMWRRAREKALLREAFGQYVAPEVLERIVNEPETLKAPAPRHIRMDFIVIQVRDDVLDEIPRRLERAFHCIAASKVLIPNIVLPYLVVTYQAQEQTSDAGQGSKDIVDRLLATLGRDARLVFGRTDGLIGAMGTQQVWYFGPAISNLSQAFQELMKLEYGTSAEVCLD